MVEARRRAGRLSGNQGPGFRVGTLNLGPNSGSQEGGGISMRVRAWRRYVVEAHSRRAGW